MSNIHIFQDELGHYLNKFYFRIKDLEYKENIPKENIIINIACKNNLSISDDVIVFCDVRELLNYLYTFKNIKNIYFHYYNFISQYILEKIKSKSRNINMHWMFWGGEFYNLPEFNKYIYFGNSIKYIEQKKSYDKIRLFFSNIKSYLFDKPFYNKYMLFKSIKKIDYFYTCISEEYFYIKSITKSNFIHKKMIYAPIELKTNSFIKEEKKNHKVIMINHNASPTMNHFDIIEKFQKIDFVGKILLPLSYGGTSSYIKNIKDYASTIFKKNSIIYLDEFIQSDKYYSYLSSIDIAIFNSTIPAGFGNIINLLWSGSTLYLREENLLYKEFKKIGINIKSIQNDLYLINNDSQLTNNQIEDNRHIIKQLYSDDSVNQYYIEMFNK
jgi:hypothetical protein